MASNEALSSHYNWYGFWALAHIVWSVKNRSAGIRSMEHLCSSEIGLRMDPLRVPATRATEIAPEPVSRGTPRSLTLHYPAERHEMLQTARTRQASEAFRTEYRKRAGIEGTFSQTLRIADLRRTRYIGIRKTHLQHLATAVATNILRVINWLNEQPLAPTRTSRFAALAAT